MQQIHQKRLSKLQRDIKKSDFSSLLVTSYPNVTYLTGFTGDSSYLLVLQDHQILISDTRFEIQLKEECPWLEVEIRKTPETMLQVVPRLVKKMRLDSVGVESESMTVAFHKGLEAELKTASIALTSGLVESLRLIKDKDEVDEIRRSIQMAERAFQVIKAGMRGDYSEKQIAADLEYQIRQFGGFGFSFDPIVGVGPRAALPHGIPSERRVEEDDFVLIDWGARAGLYVSDLTRILVTGRLSSKLQRVYDTVLNAQLAAIEKIRPGAIMSDVDAAARTYISDAGYGKYFGHGLGHGIGLEIHEAPRLAVDQAMPLKQGMVVTVEPGIYLPGWGGVRIEDDVLVTRDGHEVLSTVAKDLAECIVGI